jgi:hypothetical protein
MLAAPEFVIAKRIELLDEVEIAAELQHRMLADRMMRGQEGAEFQARRLGHGGVSFFVWPGTIAGISASQGNKETVRQRLETGNPPRSRSVFGALRHRRQDSEALPAPLGASKFGRFVSP